MSRGRVCVFVLIDALGWNIVKESGWLSDLLPFRSPLRTVLGFSSGAIPTILTGLTPANTGHWNLFYYDPSGSPFRWLRLLTWMPDCALNHRVGRKLLKEMGRRLLGLGPLFECCVRPRLLPYFNWVEKRNIYAPGGIQNAPTLFDSMQAAGIAHRVYSYHERTDEEIFRQAQSDLRRSDAEFYFLYLCEMDHFLHVHRRDEAQIRKRMAWYEERLRELYAAAIQRDRDAVFSVFSDHGMAPVNRRYDLVTEIEGLGFRMPQDYLAVYDSTMARFWFFSAPAREQILGLLRASQAGRLLSDEELQAHGVYFEDRRFGEAIFLLHAGWMLFRSDFNSSWTPAGMHGYDPADADSDALFLSNHSPSRPVRSIADLYRLMRESSALGRVAPAR